jgi:hypothetical protein
MVKTKALWASVMDNPVLMKKFNGWMTVFWCVMVPVSIFMGWVKSVPYVSALSIYALITGHLSTWQASRVEVKQEEQDSADLDKVERKVDDIHQNLNDG